LKALYPPCGGFKKEIEMQRMNVSEYRQHVAKSSVNARGRSGYALGRLKTGEMNSTERDYGAHLEALKSAGEIVWYRFEGIKFRLADKTFYTPDFAVMLADGTLQAHEVKGFWEDDAKVKIKVASAQYPIEFIAVKRRAKKDGGGWSVESF
jgi:hypothetical protein